MRVPTPDVSLVDVVFETEKNVTAEEVNAALKEAADGHVLLLQRRTISIF